MTVRKINLDLRPRAFKAPEIKAIRGDLRVSQGVFANFLGVSVSTVRDWEQGVNVPQGPACRVMEEMGRDIVAWRNRIREQATVTAE